MKILVSGFDPFNGEKINPSIEAVKRLPDTIEGCEIIKVEIPTIIDESVKKLERYIENYRPDVVLNIGQAGGRSDITVERAGINIDDFNIEDNAGNRIIDEKIVKDGSDAYFTTVPLKAIVEALRINKIPASVSNSAGTFVCNHVCYSMCYLAKKKYPAMRTGFIHIPYIPEQVIDKRGTPSMSLDNIVEGLRISIEAIIANKKDIVFSDGFDC